jgi:hypothetical protein
MSEFHVHPIYTTIYTIYSHTHAHTNTHTHTHTHTQTHTHTHITYTFHVTHYIYISESVNAVRDAEGRFM